MQAVGVTVGVMLQIFCKCEIAYKAVFQCTYEQAVGIQIVKKSKALFWYK